MTGFVHQALAIRTELGQVHTALVPAEAGHLLAGLDVPEADRRERDLLLC